MKTALITGCAGFIGSNIAERLQHKYELYGYDNFHTGKKSNLKGIKIRMRSPSNAPKLDYILLLGLPSSSPMYLKDRRLVNNAVMTTMEVLERAKDDGAKIVYASTSSMYNGNTPPFNEDMPIQVKDYYTEARHFIERLMRLYHDLYGVESVGLRLFSCYGPKDISKGIYANVVTQFAVDMIRGKRPLLYGDGFQARDFIFVDDVVDAFALAMDYPKTDIFNVGTGKSFSFNEAVDIINSTLETDIQPRYVDRQIHNYVFDTKSDTRKAKKLLGFEAKVPFTEGLHNHVLNLRGVLECHNPLAERKPPASAGG